MNAIIPTLAAGVDLDVQPNSINKPMKTTLHQLKTQAAGAAFIATLLALGLSSSRADDIWTGLGQDAYWATPGNWLGGTGPSSGDSLVFTNVVGLNNTNNFPAATPFGNLKFATPSGAFALSGNQITLNGNITNRQPVTVETINLPLALGGTPFIDVAPNGNLTINGVISGSGGVTKTDSGRLNLNGVNTFTGTLAVDGGTVAVAADSNLGAAPSSATPGSLVLDDGTLVTTNNFTLNANRGVAVGPGQGGINVIASTTLSYGGIMAGTGGLTKSGYGTLVLSGANTYTGPTTNAIGFLNLDYSGSTTANIIAAASSVTLGGGNASGAAGGGENVAQLNLAGGSGADTQSFAGVHSTFGGSVLIATNGGGGSMNVTLGSLSHDPGGVLSIVTPEASGGGHLTTASANINGILGGWVFISGDSNRPSIYHEGGNTGGNHNNGVAHDLVTGTNFATVDVSGNVVNFTGYSNVTSSATVASQVAGSPAPPNIAINDASGASVVSIDAENANTTSDINAIRWTTYSSGYDSIAIGTGNTLRLGRYGAILRNGPSTGNAVFVGGPSGASQTGSGTTGYGDIGTLTAGGADNTPGEVIVVANNPSSTSGTTIIESKIADNGTGPVTVVKMGPGSIKFDGHNTFSGGLYLLQGRVQFTGGEIGNANWTDGGGSGNIYVLPGSYLFPASTSDGPVPNPLYVAGGGDAAEAFGVIRGGNYTGPITMIGDTTIGCDTIHIDGSISGAFNLTFGCLARNGTVSLAGASDNWTGDTILSGGGTSSPHNTLINSNNEVIPNGFGYGNVIMNVGNAGGITWNLNSYNETINGLSTSGNASGANSLIENTSAGTTSTLTIGDNNQSGTFGGLLEDNGGTLALTKIGAGLETLTVPNTYSGPTIINGGTLALSGSGSISSSTNIQVNSGGTLDVSALSGNFSTANPVLMNGGTIIGDCSLGNLGLTNAALTLNIDTGGTNIVCAALTTGGATNLININTISGVSKYPAFFTIIKYSGVLSGAGNNFGLGAVPSTNTVGYVSNDVVNSRIILVLSNGPKVLTWTGTDPVNPTFWDNGVTTNWLAFKGTVDQAPSAFHKADAVIFDDTGSSSTVNLVDSVIPGSVEVTNDAMNYAFTNAGGINGKLSFTKDGTGSLLLDNGGNSGVAIQGTFAINNGTVQVGNNDASGSISAAAGIVNNSALVYERSDTTTNGSAISGTGTLTQNGAGVLALSGNNTFTGAVAVVQGTVKANSATALGDTNGATVISSGATLDVNGQSLGAEPVIVSGTGVGGLGAIVNTGPDITTALMNVTLTGNTTFGGKGRWDIRGAGGQLATSPSGSAYTLTKTATNYVALVGINVDPGLGDINVQSGTLSVETTTSGLGNAGNTLTVAVGATFQVYASTVTLNKQFVLNGTGTNTTLNCGSGTANTLSGNFSLAGNCIFNAASGTALTFVNGTMSGGASLIKSGTGTNIISSTETANYTGGTTVSNGTLVVDGTLSGNVNVAPTATLAGNGAISGTVTVTNGTVSPGNIAAIPQGTLTVGALTLSNSTVELQLATAPTNAIGNDKVVVAGALTLSGTGTNILLIVPLSYMNVGDVYTNIQYAGALPGTITNNLRVVSGRAGFAFHIVDPGTTPGFIEIQVDSALGNDFWTGAASANWDTSANNWTRNGGAVSFNNNDYVNFDDSSSVNNVNLSGALSVSGMTMLNGSKTYHFGGTGSLTNSGTLQMTGGGTVIIANAGNNDFRGLMTISSGTLQVGDGGTGGNLGSGIITNNGSLVFDRSDNALSVNSAIGGSGSLTNIGTGMVTLGGANAFDGDVNVLQGTLRVANSSALGDTFGSTYVSSGATLDITNSANVGKEAITTSGAGVGGNGAIVNSSGSSTFVGPNFSQLTITADTTIGGSGRLDFRASSASAADAVLFCSPIGSPYKLTKLGTNQFQISGATIDPGLGDIDVQNGIFGLQWQLPLGVGNPGANLILHSNTTFNLFDLSNDIAKVFIMTNATVYSQHGSNVLNGPFTLSGTNTFNEGGMLTLLGPVSGNATVVKTGASTLLLATGPESYTGDTIVNGGTLAVADPVSLTNSPHIVLSSATVDLSGRADDMLSLGSGGLPQTLAGGGTILGTLVENSGSTINPGNGVAPAVLTVTNGVALNGAVIMDLDLSAGAVTNDEILLESNLNLTVSGTLTVTNLGPTLNAGSTFQLFSVPASGFSAVNLPTTNAIGTVAYTWQNNLATAGSITVAGTVSLVNTNPGPINFVLSGGNLNLSWPTNIGWRLQVQTNNLTVGISTNWATVPGSTGVNSLSVPVVKANGAVFYRLVYP